MTLSAFPFGSRAPGPFQNCVSSEHLPASSLGTAPSSLSAHSSLRAAGAVAPWGQPVTNPRYQTHIHRRARSVPRLQLQQEPCPERRSRGVVTRLCRALRGQPGLGEPPWAGHSGVTLGWGAGSLRVPDSGRRNAGPAGPGASPHARAAGETPGVPRGAPDGSGQPWAALGCHAGWM